MPVHKEDRESRLVQSLLKRVEEVPHDVLEEMNRAADQRAYFKDSLLRSLGRDVVTTNYVYRYTAALVGDVLARDPTCKISLRDKRWGPEGPPVEMVEYGETQERLANFMGDKGDLRGAMHEVVWDAHSTPLGFVKVIWSEDFHRDPLGAPLRGPQRQNAMYRRMYQEFKDGKFDRDSEEYLVLAELSDALKGVSRDQIDEAIQERGGVEEDDELAVAGKSLLSGGLVNPKYLPDVPLFQSFSYDVIDF
jgi:hypothetical protein